MSDKGLTREEALKLIERLDGYIVTFHFYDLERNSFPILGN